jgi:Tol biopolymer transport system component
VVIIALAYLTSCGSTSTSTDAAQQYFHKLDWGAAYVSEPVWSPDGSSIAVFMGHDEEDAHLFVVSADGSTQVDEVAWRCNQHDLAAVAWLPDGGLSCVTPSADGASLDLSIAANPSAPVQALTVPGGTAGGQYGAVWLPDGSALLVSETVDVPPGTYRLGRVSSLHVITKDGRTTQSLVIPDDLTWPRWVNGASTPTLSYKTFAPDPVHLATSTVTWTPAGMITLGPPTPVPGSDSIVDSFTWSPTGQWFATAQNETSGGCALPGVGGDCVQTYTLVITNPASPSSSFQLDIPGKPFKPNLASLEGVGSEVAWSPDGQTLLIVKMDSADGRRQVYRFDVGKYLTSQGHAI